MQPFTPEIPWPSSTSWWHWQGTTGSDRLFPKTSLCEESNSRCVCHCRTDCYSSLRLSVCLCTAQSLPWSTEIEYFSRVHWYRTWSGCLASHSPSPSRSPFPLPIPPPPSPLPLSLPLPFVMQQHLDRLETTLFEESITGSETFTL